MLPSTDAAATDELDKDLTKSLVNKNASSIPNPPGELPGANIVYGAKILSCPPDKPKLPFVGFPNSYPGTLSAIMSLIMPPYFWLILVGITVSPGISNASSESLFPVPPTIAGLPFALFVGAGPRPIGAATGIKLA